MQFDHFHYFSCKKDFKYQTRFLNFNFLTTVFTFCNQMYFQEKKIQKMKIVFGKWKVENVFQTKHNYDNTMIIFGILANRKKIAREIRDMKNQIQH